MNRLKVIFLPEPHLFEPDGREVVERVGIRHDISVFEEAESLIPQFAGVEAVIDFGGSIGTREMMDAATDARLWQILGTGFDHFDLAEPTLVDPPPEHPEDGEVPSPHGLHQEGPR